MANDRTRAKSATDGAADDLRSSRATVRRIPERGVYDRLTIHAIIDAATVCHIGFVTGGQPYVIPTICARRDDIVFIHGSAASRMLRSVKRGVEMCLTATVVDGLVLARSAFHHSMNYRSAVVLGRATEVRDLEVKRDALRVVAEQVLPGRWDEVRPPTEKELRATTVLALPIEEASAKVRTGPPVDDEEDYSLPIWAGVVPLRVAQGAPMPDPRLEHDIPLAASVRRLAADRS